MHTYAYAYTYIHTYIHIYIHTHTYTHALHNKHTHTHTHTHTHRWRWHCQLVYVCATTTSSWFCSSCVLQCVAVCCSVLQCVAVCCRGCSELQCVAVWLFDNNIITILFIFIDDTHTLHTKHTHTHTHIGAGGVANLCGDVWQLHHYESFHLHSPARLWGGGRWGRGSCVWESVCEWRRRRMKRCMCVRECVRVCHLMSKRCMCARERERGA